MDANGLYITRHALERFQSRWPSGPPPQDLLPVLKELLNKAEEESLGYVAATRIMSNSFRTARYFSADGWRFVTDESGQRLLTCERIIYRKAKPANIGSHPKERRRRRRLLAK